MLEKTLDFLQQGLEHEIKDFAHIISEQYSLNFDEIFSLWKNKNSIPNKTMDTSKEPIAKVNKLDTPSNSELLKANKNMLIAMCKQKTLKVSGNKAELINRLLGLEKESPKKVAKKAVIKDEKVEALVNKLNLLSQTIQIRRNKFGNYEHSETKFVFSKVDKTVIGKQDDDGTISELTLNNINECNRYKFKYILPENLDSVNKEEDEDEDEEYEEVEEYVTDDGEEYEEVEVEEYEEDN